MGRRPRGKETDRKGDITGRKREKQGETAGRDKKGETLKRARRGKETEGVKRQRDETKGEGTTGPKRQSRKERKSEKCGYLYIIIHTENSCMYLS